MDFPRFAFAEMSEPAANEETFHPVAGLLGILLPGLGHVSLGEAYRGVMVLAGVLGLFAGGLLIGGVDAIDSREDFWWFVGQAGVGPVAFAVDQAHQGWFKVEDPRAAGNVRSYRPDEDPPIRKSLGHANELGALYMFIAGMLNAIAVIDATWHARPRRRVKGVVGRMETAR